MFKKLLSLALLFALVFGLGFGIRPAAAAVTELTIIWAQWAPADYLQTLVKDYEAVAGVKVNVVQEPWGTFLNRVAAEWAAKGSAFDMVVGDSQWLGQGASQGHYVELTDFMKNNGDLAKTVTPARCNTTANIRQVVAGIGPSPPKATPTAGRTAKTCLKTPKKKRPSKPSMAVNSPSRPRGRN